MKTAGVSLPWHPDSSPVFIVVLSFVFLILVHHFVTESGWFRSFSKGRPDKHRGEILRVLVKRGLFIVLIGIIPAVLVVTLLGEPLRASGVLPVFDRPALLWAAVLTIAMTAAAILTQGKAESQRNYPQIRISRWSAGALVANAASWGVYLFAYEFGYRGLLLLLAAQLFGPWPAIAVSTGIYAALHINKGPVEAIGCIPVGVLFCAAVLQTGTIWVTFIPHFISAVINDVLAVHTNPQSCFVRATRKRVARA